jgi:hypothetical protein
MVLYAYRDKKVVGVFVRFRFQWNFKKRKNHYFTTRAEITISTGETVLNFVPIIT